MSFSVCFEYAKLELASTLPMTPHKRRMKFSMFGNFPSILRITTTNQKINFRSVKIFSMLRGINIFYSLSGITLAERSLLTTLC
jgi:hypothetical protein